MSLEPGGVADRCGPERALRMGALRTARPNAACWRVRSSGRAGPQLRASLRSGAAPPEAAGGSPHVALLVDLRQRQQALLAQRLEGAHQPLIPGVPDVVAADRGEVKQGDKPQSPSP